MSRGPLCNYLLSPKTRSVRRSGGCLLRNIAIVAIVAAVGLGVYEAWGHLKIWMKAAQDMVTGLGLWMGVWAVPVWVLLCWLTTAVSGPAILFEVSGGILFGGMYGPRQGAIVAMFVCGFGVWLGSITAFELGRRFLKPKVAKIIEDHPTLRTINYIVTKEGWMFAFLMRLNPVIPFEIFNYAIAMSDISFSHNALAAFGTMPLVCFEVYSGVAAAEVAHSASRGENCGEKLREAGIKFGVGLIFIIASAMYGKMKYDAKVIEDKSDQGSIPSMDNGPGVHEDAKEAQHLSEA